LKIAAPTTVHHHVTGASRLAAHDVVDPWHAWIYYRDLIVVLLAKEFKVRYKSTFMGYAWSLMHPVVLALIFFTVFSLVMNFQFEGYALYLIAGLFPWQWISNTVGTANFYFLGNSSLIKKVCFHRSMLVLAGVLNESVHFLVSVPVILGVMLYYHKFPQLNWLWMVPALVVVQVALAFGVALLIATCNLFFRDLERLMTLGMQVLFYLTPICYPITRMPPRLTWLFYANPFGPIVICWQGLFFEGQVPLNYLAMATLWSVTAMAAGWLVYSKNVWRFAEIV